jgi:hypothetical protein
MMPSSVLRPISLPKKRQKPEEVNFTPEEKADFKRFNKIVEKGVKAFWEVGEALGEIKEAKLWKAGGYKSWDEYVRAVGGMSRGHAHRLLEATEFVNFLKTSPRGDVLPAMEAQVRPILSLPDNEQRAEAWSTAIKASEGQQPTGPQVRKVVFEILHPDNGEEKPRSRGQQRVELVARLKKVIQRKKSWAQVEKLLEELEALL